MRFRRGSRRRRFVRPSRPPKGPPSKTLCTLSQCARYFSACWPTAEIARQGGSMRTIVKGIAVSIVLTTLYSVTGLSGQRAVSLAAPITVRADADGYVEYLGMVRNSGEKP